MIFFTLKNTPSIFLKKNKGVNNKNQKLWCSNQTFSNTTKNKTNKKNQNKQKTRSSVIKKNPKKLILFKQNNKQIRSLFIGILLGGGSISRSSPNFNAILTLTLSKNSKVASFIHKILTEKGYCNPVSNPLAFNTYALPSLNEIHELFYQQSTNQETKRFIRQIPSKIEKFLDAQTLAFWFLQRGILEKDQVIISVKTQTAKEDLLIINALKNKFQLDCQILDKKVIFSKTETPKFISFIKPYTPPIFFYKLGILPINFSTKPSFYLHLFYGPTNINTNEVISKLTKNAKLKVKYYSIVDYNFGQNKSAFEVFISLETAFDFENFHLLTLADTVPVYKLTGFGNATALYLAEQKSVFNTFPKEVIITDFLKHTRPLKDFSVIKTLFKQLPENFNAQEINELKELLPSTDLQTEKRKSIFTAFSERFLNNE
jgi:hypothetical protein